VQSKFFIPSYTIDCSAIPSMLDCMVYLTVVFFRRKGITSISYKTFMLIARVGRNTVAGSLKRLAQAGWIEYKVGRGRVNEFKSYFLPGDKKMQDMPKHYMVPVAKSTIDKFLSGATTTLGKKGNVVRDTYRSKMTRIHFEARRVSNVRAGNGSVSFGPSMESMSEKFGKSVRTVQRYVNILKEQSSVRRIRRKYQQNKYVFVDDNPYKKYTSRKGNMDRKGIGFVGLTSEKQKSKTQYFPREKNYAVIDPTNGRKAIRAAGQWEDRSNAVLGSMRPPPHAAMLKFHKK